MGSPDQERDETGKWTAGGGAGAWAKAKVASGRISASRAEDVGVKVKLLEKHENYFKVGASTKIISLDKVTPTRARPEGIRHAEVKMIHAFNSGGSKRDPISLEHQGDGTYKVMDGNSTFAIAQKHGWKGIAANVWEKGQWKDPKAGKH